MTECEIVAAGAPERLDHWLRRQVPGLSRRVAHAWIAEGCVRVDGRPARKGSVVRPGVRVRFPAVAGVGPAATVGLSILFADEALVVVDKPGGVPSHALDPRERGTIANALVARYPETAALAGGLAHRLDTGTSGVLVAARRADVWEAVRAAFRARTVGKEYLALVEGLPPATCTIEVPLAHDPHDRRRMLPARPGLRAWPAVSVVQRLATDGRVSLVHVVMRTGVTHQIRAHLALRGHPLLGDALYGGPAGSLPAGRHALHAARLTLPTLLGRPPATFESPLPPDLRALRPARGAG
jgi:23S rRNA pseudouridine1911/1915/1917 synthase